VRNINDAELNKFLYACVTRGHTTNEQQELVWRWGGGSADFVLKQGIILDAGNQQYQLQLAQEAVTELQMKGQQLNEEAEEMMLNLKMHEELLTEVLEQAESEFPEAFIQLLLWTERRVQQRALFTNHEWAQNKRPRPGGEKGSFEGTSAAQTIETGTEAEILTAIFASEFHSGEAATGNVCRQDVESFLKELRYDPSIATVHEYTDVPLMGGPEGSPKIEREYCLKICQDSFSTVALENNPGLTGKA